MSGDSLLVRSPRTTGGDVDALREQIDVVDESIVTLLARRQQLVARLARVKALGAMPIRDLPREQTKLRAMNALARAVGLDADDISHIFRRIIDMSVRIQEQMSGAPPRAVSDTSPRS